MIASLHIAPGKALSLNKKAKLNADIQQQLFREGLPIPVSKITFNKCNN